MIKNGKLYSSSLTKKNKLHYSHKKLKINNNIFTINNKENYFINNKDTKDAKDTGDTKDPKENKSIFNKMKNKVLISNTYNFKNEEIKRKNLKTIFFSQKLINDNNGGNNKQEINNFNDIYYYKNYDFLTKNKLTHNIGKSQRLFRFSNPIEDKGKEEKKINVSIKKFYKINEGKNKSYRYSSSNIYDNYNNNNVDINKNNLPLDKSNILIKKNKMINSAASKSFQKVKNILFPKDSQKLLKFHKTNYVINNKNASKDKIGNILINKDFKIKVSAPRKIKNRISQNKTLTSKKRPLSTRYKLNIPKNINSLDDLLDINEKNCVNSLSNQLTKYTIGKTIGRGAYAIVKIVTNNLTNENFAAKIYKRCEIKDKIRKNCVNNEIEILKRISHKNIIKLIEVIELKEHILIIQELFLGVSLASYYKKYWKTEDLNREKERVYKIILKQIFEAINYLHMNSIAHLDIKLDNILINKNLEIKLIDFGFGIYDPKKTLNTFFGGTPNYMSPEIVLKRPYISIYSDIWSLGVLVFKLFCNEYPFKGLTEKDLYNCIKKGKYRIKCYVNYDIKKIINSMLVLEPNKRGSCEQLLKNPWFCYKTNKLS